MLAAEDFSSTFACFLVAGLLYHSNRYKGSPLDVDVQKSPRQHVPDIKLKSSACCCLTMFRRTLLRCLITIARLFRYAQFKVRATLIACNTNWLITLRNYNIHYYMMNTRSLTHSLIRQLIYSLAHWLNNVLNHFAIHSTTHLLPRIIRRTSIIHQATVQSDWGCGCSPSNAVNNTP